MADPTKLSSRPFTVMGLVATGAYACLIGAYVFAHWDKMADLKPNELGDFLAGVLTFPAFLWLVIGYFQQGIELKQNTEALRLQVQELAHSVEHQAESARVAREQLRQETDAREMEREQQIRESQPDLRPDLKCTPGIDSCDYTLTLTNYGTDIYDVEFHGDPALPRMEAKPEVLAIVRRSATVEMRWEDNFPWEGPFVLVVTYTTSIGKRGTRRFELWQPKPDEKPCILRVRAAAEHGASKSQG